MKNFPNSKDPGKSRKFKRVLVRTAILLGTIVLVISILVLHRSSPQVIAADRIATELIQQKLNQAEALAAAGKPQVVRLDSSELNSIIHARLAATHAPVGNRGRLRDLRVHLAGDQIGVHVLLDIYGAMMTFDIAGTLRTVGDYVRFDPVSARIGALPIPQPALTSALQQAMSSPQGRENMRLPRQLRDLTVRDSKLIATYK